MCRVGVASGNDALKCAKEVLRHSVKDESHDECAQASMTMVGMGMHNACPLIRTRVHSVITLEKSEASQWGSELVRVTSINHGARETYCTQTQNIKWNHHSCAIGGRRCTPVTYNASKYG